MGVFAFVGLNESGKTTILEAIHSFHPDRATGELFGGEEKSGVPFRERVPRYLISNFNKDVSVTATIELEGNEKGEIIEQLKSDHGITLDPDSLGNQIILERHQRFKAGDFDTNYFTIRNLIKIKTGRERKWRDATLEELMTIRDFIYESTPDIAYFPTFVFDFPSRIFLTEERGDNVSKFYRGVFQDILNYDDQGLTIEDSIIRRIRGSNENLSWGDFLQTFNASKDKDKIQHVLDRAGAVVTEVVFERWNQIFNEEVKGKEINFSSDIVQGEYVDESGSFYQTEERDFYIKFQIKDGTRRFSVNDRSLGFRWFFAFMLFTQFRVARKDTKPVLFLFDEPASNLHAASQQKLIKSFPEIAKGSHTLVYTTHSHYMIDPKWLEQTFIVTNHADAPNNSVIDAVSLDDESLNIRAFRYRTFVNDYPNQTNYFQPILDRLEVVPSRFDIQKDSVVLEGKSDYYILRYGAEMIGEESFALLPGGGAGTFGALISLSVGWNLNMLFMLDGDTKGKEERERYVNNYGLSENKVVTIDQINNKVRVIEDLLNDEARKIISNKLKLGNESLTKNHIRQYFQESLARNEIHSLGSNFENNIRKIFNTLEEQISKINKALDSQTT